MQYCFSIAKLNMEISGSGQFEILIYYHLEKNHGGSEKGRNRPIGCLSAITCNNLGRPLPDQGTRGDEVSLFQGFS